jgi:hypothetical protein
MTIRTAPVFIFGGRMFIAQGWIVVARRRVAIVCGRMAVQSGAMVMAPGRMNIRRRNIVIRRGAMDVFPGFFLIFSSHVLVGRSEWQSLAGFSPADVGWRWPGVAIAHGASGECRCTARQASGHHSRKECGMSRNFLPSADAQLLAWSVNFNTLIVATPTAFGLTAAQATAYTGRHDAYASAYQTAFDPNTRTGPAIEAKDLAKKALDAEARELVRIVQAFPSLTDDQRRSLKITVRKSRTPTPAPSVRPGMDLISVSMRTVTVHIHDSASIAKRGKPAGALGAKVYTFVGSDYPSDPTLWDYQGDTTRAKHEITFPDSVPSGAQVWVCAAWYNRKGETGPASVPITTNVQGGGSNSSSMNTQSVKIAA